MNLKQKLFEHNNIQFACAIIGVGLNTLLTIWIAFLLMDFTDVAVSGNMESLQRMLIKFAIFLLLFLASNAFAFYFKNRFIERGIRQYKQEAFRRMLKKHIASFQKESTSTYISALTNDVNSIELNYMEGSLNILIQALMFFGGLAAMAYLHLGITIAVILTCLIPLSISIAFGKSIASAEQKTSAQNASFTGLVKDLLTGFSVIKSFQSEREFTNSFASENASVETRKRKKRDLISTVMLFSGGGGILVNLAIFGFGAYLAIHGEITAGTLIAFVQLSNYVISPLQTLPALMNNQKASTLLIDKMEAACQEEAEAVQTHKESFESVMTLEHVTFGYEEGNTILQDVNLRFEKGKSYAIVGGSGSGKSTLLQLLLDYHTFEGEIAIDGISIKDFSHDDLFELCALIQQNVFLFDDTLLHNMTMLKDFDAAAIQSAVTKSGLKELWDSKGSDYACGENGCHLSGGEKQRVSIARSLLKQTSILLLDEATAALDPITAAAVEEAILSLSGMTNIVVTHKLQKELLSKYDEIIVLGNQRVLEQGSFQQLYDQKGYFYSLYQIQA